MTLPTKVNDQAAYCLHRINYGESSLILDCLTVDYGRVSLMVKSGRKRKNQAPFQLFQPLQVNFSGKSDLKTLTGLECISHQLSPKANIVGMYVNELLIYLLPKHEDCHVIFEAYRRLLLQLNDQDLEQPVREFEYELLSFLGVLPDFLTDSHNNSEVNTQLYYQYNPIIGFKQSDNGKGILGQHILAIARGKYDKVVLKEAKNIMRQTIQWQLNGKELKTRALFQQLFSRKKNNDETIQN
ncbi:MAG: DNA repair protein RecO [Gammaproteobacteria bacterium]|nr:DNA repair protein RecO [Gammaproteobacteria bacterium]